MRRPFALMTATAVTAGGLTLAPHASPATIEAGSLRTQPTNIQRTEVCFTVNNIGDPEPQQVSGTLIHNENYAGGGTGLLLQHGAVADRSAWDGGRPRVTGAVSMVDLLAEAGYVVFAIDRLGYGRSTYRPEQEGAGWTLTMDSQLEMTHEMVTQIREGTYRITTTDTCPGGVPAGRRPSKVVLMGFSSGALLIEYYATRYHDIDGIVSLGWSSNCCGNRWNKEVTEGVVAQQLARGEDYVYYFEPDENGYAQVCEDLIFHADGISEGVVEQICGPEGYGAPSHLRPKTPSGEFTTYIPVLLNMSNLIPNVVTPTLLVYMDKDLAVTNAQTGGGEPDTVTTDMEYWTTNLGCNCDVEFLWQRNSGHAGWFHDSATEMTADVVEWLRSRGL